ncbi:tRNA adenosine(34) deaminase TadA [Desulfobotulus sp.]|jgi:tRNA(adenine34) deaminase|uniref:tRNA adenosine(34) deaminase TadA n=1 Tax=Desulfobotulus sp. TaxID=1940337 RepID=UPI002A371815|nr:tRNA adenosine(34) deaminase TadA [Desulfobotulus sp.]MDY0162009.1 tRNA adenosine(34) deaminase TadA [Desulfobotulus sp.]
MKDEYYMQLALAAAEKAGQMDEVPIGAVIVQKTGLILATAWNRTISLCDPTAHAEILALRKAAALMGNYRLPDTTLYVTIEPCIMCMGAMVHARITRLVYGAADIKWGGAGSLYDLSHDVRLNHRMDVRAGVLEAPCREKLQLFFRQKRQNAKDAKKPQV